MKTNLDKQTKYYRKYFDKEKSDFVYEEISLNKKNWWYVQVDASIRYAFLKHHLKLPRQVVIQFCSHYTYVNIFRAPLNTISQIKKWEEKYLCVLDELEQQAKCNSTDNEDNENWIKYEFKII
jgi:hypothetical protein